MTDAEGFTDTLIRPVAWETSAKVRGRALFAELHAGFIVMWQKGGRERVSVDLEAVYDLGRKLEARARRA